MKNEPKTDDFIKDLSEDLTEVKVTKPLGMFCKWLCFSAIYTFLIILVSGLREDISLSLKEASFSSEMILAVITSALSAYLSFLIAIPNDKYKKIFNLLPVIPFLIMGYVIANSGSISSEALKASFKDDHFTITLALIVYSIPTITYSFFLVKKLSPTSLMLNGFTIVLSATALSHFILRMTQMTDNLAPIFVWCYMPVILVAFGGIYLGKKFLKW